MAIGATPVLRLDLINLGLALKQARQERGKPG